MYRFSLVALLALLAATSTASAADKKADAEARRYYEEGTKYYSLGTFDRAIENYKKAFEIKPDPVFLYNIGQAYRLAGDLPQAAFFYKSFLRSMPNAPNRVEVDSRIRELESAIAKQKEAGQPSSDPPVATEPGAKAPAAAGRTSTTTHPTEPPVVAPPATATSPGDPTRTSGASAEARSQAAAGASGVGRADGAAKVPTAEQAIARSQGGPAVQLGASSSGSASRSSPFYATWWFWTAVGVVVAGAAVGVVMASGAKGSAPAGDFPSIAVF